MANEKKWVAPVFQGFLGNVIYALAVLLLGGGVTYFSLITPQWGAALLKGFFAAVMLMVATAAWRIMVAFTPRRQPTTTENIEERVKEWLFKHGLSIKNEPSDVAHFLFFATTGGGAKIYVGRGKDDGQSLTFAADLKASKEEVKLAESMTAGERLRLVHAMQLELSRAVIAYKGLDYLGGFRISKKVAITPTLDETEIMAALWEVEAVLNSVLVILRMATLRLSERLEHEKTKNPS